MVAIVLARHRRTVRIPSNATCNSRSTTTVFSYEESQVTLAAAHSHTSAPNYFSGCADNGSSSVRRAFSSVFGGMPAPGMSPSGCLRSAAAAVSPSPPASAMGTGASGASGARGASGAEGTGTPAGVAVAAADVAAPGWLVTSMVLAALAFSAATSCATVPAAAETAAGWVASAPVPVYAVAIGWGLEAVFNKHKCSRWVSSVSLPGHTNGRLSVPAGLKASKSAPLAGTPWSACGRITGASIATPYESRWPKATQW